MAPKWSDDFIRAVEAEVFQQANNHAILQHIAALTIRDVYCLRAVIVERLVERGDRLVGYKAAGSSAAVRRDEHVEGPLVGCILGSRIISENDLIEIGSLRRMAVEGEIAVSMKCDLEGPGVNDIDVMSAVGAVFPAIEILAFKDAAAPSIQKRILGSNFTGKFILGQSLSPAGIGNLQNEGMSLHINGQLRGSGTGAEIMGHPFNSVMMIANTLAVSGQKLRAGMVVLTGSVLPNISVAAGDLVSVQFTRLGRLRARFTQ